MTGVRSPMLDDVPAGTRWVLVVTIAHVLAYTLGLGPAAQFPTALLFYVTCPGAILVDWVNLSDLPSRVALTVGASLAHNMLVVTLLLAAGVFSAGGGLAAISAASLLLATLTASIDEATRLGALPLAQRTGR